LSGDVLAGDDVEEHPPEMQLEGGHRAKLQSLDRIERLLAHGAMLPSRLPRAAFL
jgi:hypothetical protein